MIELDEGDKGEETIADVRRLAKYWYHEYAKAQKLVEWLERDVQILKDQVELWRNTAKQLNEELKKGNQ